MAEMKWVRAQEGLRVPKEESSHRYIEREPVKVPMSTYYHRRLADQELVELDKAEAEAAEEKAKRLADEGAKAEEAALAEAHKKATSKTTAKKKDKE